VGATICAIMQIPAFAPVEEVARFVREYQFR
jgi:hypothetical protein